MCIQIPYKWITKLRSSLRVHLCVQYWIYVCIQDEFPWTLNMFIPSQPITSCSPYYVGLHYIPYLILDRRHTSQFKLIGQYCMVLVIIIKIEREREREREYKEKSFVFNIVYCLQDKTKGWVSLYNQCGINIFIM